MFPFDSTSSAVISSLSIYGDVTLSAADIKVYEKVVYAGKVKKKLKKIRSVRTGTFILPSAGFSEPRKELPPAFCKYEQPVREDYRFLFFKEINPPPPKYC